MAVDNSGRFAIYFTFSKDNALYQKAAQWLGHCVYNQATDATGEFSQASEKFRAVQQAAQYGFHATLKPPFRLQPGSTRTELEKGLQVFASRLHPFTCPPLKITSIGSFIALTSIEPCDELNHLACKCVQDFESFRAPLNESEMQKRLRSPLTPRQQHLLNQWGYPYVLDEFRFHMTLSDRLPDNMIEEARGQLALEFSPLLTSNFQIDRICLCHQAQPDDPFYLLQSYRLGTGYEPGSDSEY